MGPSPLWIVLPTIEGAAFGCLIASYETAQVALPRLLDRTLSHVGAVSYSLYLWHVVALSWAHRFITFPLDFEQAALLALALFAPMVLIASLSYECIERPFLGYRVKYTRNRNLNTEVANPGGLLP